MNVDFTALTVWQVFGLAALLALLDTGGSMALAVVKGTFSLGSVAVWVQSHVLRRVFPIVALAILGHGIGTAASWIVPPIDTAFDLALVALAAYALETIASLRDSFGGDTAPPKDTAPQT
jgi:hypothetical protein